jgi:hypothetical protein
MSQSRTQKVNLDEMKGKRNIIEIASDQSEHQLPVIYKSMSNISERILLDLSTDFINQFLIEISDYNSTIMNMVGEMQQL